MHFHALVAAKELCRYSNWSISNLKLQKLLYIAHMYALGRSNGESPLLAQNFEAWDYGPVLPDVYHKGKTFGSGTVGNVFHSIAGMTDGVEKDLIHECFDALGGSTAAELVAVTHWERGAWAKNYIPGKKGIVIPNDDILKEYEIRDS